MKKLVKIAAGVVAIGLIGVLLLFANGLMGNPFSKVLAERTAIKYIESNYSHLDLKVEKVIYNFKTGGYHAKIISPTSIDTHFDVLLSPFGKVLRDAYETEVLSGWNTAQRLNEDYRKMTDKIFNAPDFSYITHIDFGSIRWKEADVEIDSPESNHGIPIEKLKLDKEYNIKELAKTAGHLTLYVQDEEVTVAKAGEILLELKKLFDKEDIPFYAIDFVLEKPRNEDGTPGENRATFRVNDFLYDDIYDKDLEGRLKKAAKALEEYYARKDAKN